MLLAVLAAVVGLNCLDPAAMQQAWNPGIQAFERGDMAAAKANTDALIAVCPDAETAWHPRVMRSLIAVREGDFAGAAKVLAPVPGIAPNPIGAYPSFIALRAYAGLKDQAAFAEVRRKLVAASAHALTDPAGEIKGRAVETFTTRAGDIQAFETAFQQGRFGRRYVFLFIPSEAFAPPASLMLSTDPAADEVARQTGGTPMLFLDQYSCGGHATVAMLPKAPSYPALKALVVDAVEGRAKPLSSSTGPSDGVCINPQFVAPGL